MFGRLPQASLAALALEQNAARLYTASEQILLGECTLDFSSIQLTLCASIN